MIKDFFANSLGHTSYAGLKTLSTLILKRNDNYYYIAKSTNEFIVWLDRPLYCRYIATFKSFEEARNYILGTPKRHHRFRDLFHHRIA